jgi:hypothetical protein
VVDGSWKRDFRPQPDGAPGLWFVQMRPFDTGAVPFPALRVTYRDAQDVPHTVEVPAGALPVASVRPPAVQGAPPPDDELLPLRGPAAIPREYDTLWQALLVAAIVVAAAVILARYLAGRRVAPAAPAEPQLPPGLWALREIDRRSQLPVCQTGPAKAIMTQVSEVVRIYIQRRYGVAAMDMTTLETLQALQPILQGHEVLRWLQQFLEECDLAKFTCIEPPRGRWLAIWDDARLIVKLTTSHEELGGEAPASSAPPPSAPSEAAS